MIYKLVKSQEYETELSKLEEIFSDVEPGKKKLVDGLIEDAAFLYAENLRLREVINNTGMVRLHPAIDGLQKPTEAAKMYLKNVNSYAVVIKALNAVLSKNPMEDDDEFDKWIASKTALDEGVNI